MGLRLFVLWQYIKDGDFAVYAETLGTVLEYKSKSANVLYDRFSVGCRDLNFIDPL
ncbi:MAG: hypothetical protein GY809_00155 [Planctomycetes bacterium]|nr:hypothetical protein [Planctomycetota bacterium]